MAEITKLPLRIRTADNPEQATYLAWCFEFLAPTDPDEFRRVQVDRREPNLRDVAPYWRVSVVTAKTVLGGENFRVLSCHPDYVTASYAAYVVGCHFGLLVVGALPFDDEGDAA